MQCVPERSCCHPLRLGHLCDLYGRTPPASPRTRSEALAASSGTRPRPPPTSSDSPNSDCPPRPTPSGLPHVALNGAANLVPTFNAVPLDMRLAFHAQLMQMNGITMQGAMGVSALSTLALAAMTRGVSRRLAGGAGILVVASLLITRLGNVPINGRIKQWAATSAPTDHAEILTRWELFNYARTALPKALTTGPS
ncbi:DUF1772 domain-containing protein [Streptomyces sp. NBC_01166]|nr:DUF1772 domain-containing protein [Streptomyces sp. NBC_01166]